jgi:hypothetical protein
MKKRKSPNPILGGMKSILARKSKEKVRKQAQVILSLEIPQTPFGACNIFFFVTNSQSLHYAPNQALSDQRQAIWIGRQCFLVRVKSLFMQIKESFEPIRFSITLKLKFKSFVTNQMSLHL